MATDPVTHQVTRAEWLESELSRVQSQNTELKRRVAEQAREIGSLKRFRFMLTEQEPSDAREAAISMAARATLQADRANASLAFERRAAEQLRSALGDALENLADALRSLGASACESCSGTGHEFEGHYDADRADILPECEDCAGIGYDWSAAHAGGAA